MGVCKVSTERIRRGGAGGKIRKGEVRSRRRSRSRSRRYIEKRDQEIGEKSSWTNGRIVVVNTLHSMLNVNNCLRVHCEWMSIGILWKKLRLGGDWVVNHIPMGLAAWLLCPPFNLHLY